VPSKLDLSLFSDGRFELKEAPNFPIRGVHHHTQHPLELTEFLNGFDITYPSAASSDLLTKGTKQRVTAESWDSMMPEFELVMEWMVANKQNRWQWILLYADEWDAFAWSDLRKSRIGHIVDVAHSWGIVIGAGTACSDHMSLHLFCLYTHCTVEQSLICHYRLWYHTHTATCMASHPEGHYA